MARQRLIPLWTRGGGSTGSYAAAPTYGNVDGATLTYGGFSGSPPDIDFRYRIFENQVHLWVLTTGGSLTGTSTGTNFTIDGFPVAIRPVAARQWVTSVTDNGVVVLARAQMSASGGITFARLQVTSVSTPETLPVVNVATGWTASGTKGLGANFQMAYPLADS